MTKSLDYFASGGCRVAVSVFDAEGAGAAAFLDEGDCLEGEGHFQNFGSYFSLERTAVRGACGDKLLEIAAELFGVGIFHIESLGLPVAESDHQVHCGISVCGVG